MNFSEMKDRVINGVKWYFNKNWNRDDMMNTDEISDEVHSTLKMNMRIVTSMLAAYSFDSSVGFIFNYIFKIEQRYNSPDDSDTHYADTVHGVPCDILPRNTVRC
uniref:Uncharacterized protein n=1 Tax=Solanum tuberosum TaxID=4113 RepID=M1DDN9_SOLTU